MLNQIYIHYITTLFVLESFIISCWLLKGKKIGIGIGQFARKKSVSESATKNHDRASLIYRFIYNLKINEIDVLCLHLVTRYRTQNIWDKSKHFIRLF